MMVSVGDTVNYHSIIGGPITSKGHKVTHVELMPNNYGCDVVWLEGKQGCVAVKALSNEVSQPRIKLSRSQQNYEKYLQSNRDMTFAEWMGFNR